MNWMIRRCRRISDGDTLVISAPCRWIVPDVGSISLTIMRAAVDLPHPDSPTMLRVLPASTANEMPSTARTEPCRPLNKPRRTGKCLTRPSTSRIGAVSAMHCIRGTFGVPAGREMRWCQLAKRRCGRAALIGRQHAARGKSATGKVRSECRQRAGDLGKPGLLLAWRAVEPGHRAQESHGVGVTRVPE